MKTTKVSCGLTMSLDGYAAGIIMKTPILTLLIILSFAFAHAQSNTIDRAKIKEDLHELTTDLSQQYIYLHEKKVDLNCIRDYYESQISNIKTEEETVLFFEYLLDEFYDSHLILNTNRNSSYRLYAPVYVTLENKRAIISNIWQTQIEQLDQNLIGAELLKINGMDLETVIEQFPTHCQDKTSNEVREWIINKALAGRYNKSRVLTLQSKTGKIFEFDLDKIKIKQTTGLLASNRVNGIGIIRINNSLGNNTLVTEFDKSMDELMDTKGLIIDLRNTVDGGNSYVARGIMSRFIDSPKPYQKHYATEQYGNNPRVDRELVEYISPRGTQYTKPVVVLVGRWTGSMGEGLAIGFEGIQRGEIVGSEMERLAGEMEGFSFRNQTYGYRLSTAKLYHVNGTLREQYVPVHYVKQTTTEKDETLERGIELLNKMTN